MQPPEETPFPRPALYPAQREEAARSRYILFDNLQKRVGIGSDLPSAVNPARIQLILAIALLDNRSDPGLDANQPQVLQIFQ